MQWSKQRLLETVAFEAVILTIYDTIQDTRHTLFIRKFIKDTRNARDLTQ